MAEAKRRGVYQSTRPIRPYSGEQLACSGREPFHRSVGGKVSAGNVILKLAVLFLFTPVLQSHNNLARVMPLINTNIGPGRRSGRYYAELQTASVIAA